MPPVDDVFDECDIVSGAPSRAKAHDYLIYRNVNEHMCPPAAS